MLERDDERVDKIQDVIDLLKIYHQEHVIKLLERLERKGRIN